MIKYNLDICNRTVCADSVKSRANGSFYTLCRMFSELRFYVYFCLSADKINNYSQYFIKESDAMKTIRKTAAAAMCFLLASLTFTGCGGTDPGTPAATSGNTSAETSAADTASDNTADQKETASAAYTVGICQLVEHDALDAATSGFKDALKEKLGADITFKEELADGSPEKCSEICDRFVSDGCSLIMANATPALQAAAAATDTIPIVATSVTDYATALDLSYWGGTTGKNITGTCDLAPIDRQEDVLVELFPNAKQVGIIYTAKEANSKFQTNAFEKALTEDGIEFTEYTVEDNTEFEKLLSDAAAESDVIYIPTDNLLASKTEIIKNVMVSAGKPIIAGEEGICKGCGVATLAISYYDIGYAAGEMAYEIMVNGADPGAMEIKNASGSSKKYNSEICLRLDIVPPDSYSPIE